MSDPVAQVVAREAVSHLERLFCATGAHGTKMAVQATERLEDPAAIAGSCVALTAELLEGIRTDHSGDHDGFHTTSR
jgi:methionyl-tRNA synthetase